MSNWRSSVTEDLRSVSFRFCIEENKFGIIIVPPECFVSSYSVFALKMLTKKEFETIHFYNEQQLNLKSVLEKPNLGDEDDAVNFCNLTNIIDQFNTWMKYMPNITPFYAIKCNDELPILKTLASLGTGFDCASKNEIKKILELGVSPDRIVYANPMKSKSYIDYAKSVKVTDHTVDNEFEIYKIFKYYQESNVILRFRSDAKTALTPLENKFGCDANENGAAIMILAKTLNINMIGVGFHVGSSGCLELPSYERAISTASTLYRFGQLNDHNFKILDIGGGFPGGDNVIFANIAEIITNSLAKYFTDLDVKVIAEPGRFFVHTAYTNLSKVLAKREVRADDGQLKKAMYYVNDGIFGTFCISAYEDALFKPIHFKDKNSELFDSFIWGPTCDARDKIRESIRLPSLEEGDILAFPNMGAYTISLMCTFNGFERPKTLFYLRSDYVDHVGLDVLI